MTEWPYHQGAPNVEPPGMEILGGLPIQGDELLASMGVNLEEGFQEEAEAPESEQKLPVLGVPQTD